MSHPSNGEEISSTVKAVAGTCTSPSTSPNTRTPKKRRPNLSGEEKVKKVNSVKKALEEALKQCPGGNERTKTELKNVILKAHEINFSQFTRWQQICEICWNYYDSHKVAFTCNNKKCSTTHCKHCVAKEVIRILCNHSIYRHSFFFRCMSCQTDAASNLTLSKDSEVPRREALIGAMLAHIQVLLKENELNLVPLMGSLVTFATK